MTSGPDIRAADPPLSGIKVLEVATIVAGPYAGRILTDFGADVVKVEDPVTGGDPGRGMPPMKNGMALVFARLNLGKRSVAVNLRTEAGRAVLRRMVGGFDALLVNFREDTARQWGLTYDQLCDDNPSLIVAHLTGFGKGSDYGSRPGFGTIMDGISGYAFRNGWPDKPPTVAPFGLADQVAGMAMAFGVAMSLYDRTRTRRGADIDMALYEPLMSIMSDAVLRYSTVGEIEERNGNDVDGAAPRGVFQTGDGHWVVLSGSSPSTGRRFVKAVGLDPDDPKWVDNPSRVKNQKELNAIIAKWVVARNRDEVLRIMDDFGVPCGPINSGADIANDPAFRKRGSIVSVRSAELGDDAVVPGRLFQMGGLPPTDLAGPPSLGAHTDEVLCEQGFSEAEIRDLRARGAVS